MTETLDRRERREVCDLLLTLGPDAPTLCEGWNAFDLAVHLVVRERSVRAAPGIALGHRVAAFARQNEAASARVRSLGFAEVVRRVRAGPPLALRPISRVINVNEYAIHHEDVRRANGMGPRVDRSDLQDALWRQYRWAARFVPGRPKHVGLVLQRPDGASITLGRPPALRVTGEPLDLGLFLFGRRAVAAVEIEGDPEARRAYDAANLGL